MAKENRFPSSRRTEQERAEDLELIFKLRQRDPPEDWRSIARIIRKRRNIEISHVALYCQYKREIRKGVKVSREAFILEELGKLEVLEEELWDSWDKSKKKTKRSIVKYVPKKVKDPNTGEIKEVQEIESVTVTEEEAIGDPRIADKLLKLFKDRKEMLGLYPNNGRGGDKTSDAVFDKTEEEMEKTEAILIVKIPDNGRKKTK